MPSVFSRRSTLRGVLPLLIVGLLPALFGAAAHATTIRPFDLRELSTTAHVIVRGRVVSEEARLAEDGMRIYRDTAVEVVERVKGRGVPDRITVRQMGGTVDGITMFVPGTAELQEGEEVVLFLRAEEPYHYLVGMHQGRFSIQRPEPGNLAALRAAVVTRAPVPPRAEAPGGPCCGGHAVSVAPALEGEGAPFLNDFLADVREHLRRARELSPTGPVVGPPATE